MSGAARLFLRLNICAKIPSLRGIFVFDKKAFYAYTKGMGKIKTLEQKLDAILEYLDIDLDYREGFEVKKHKEEIGFHEREKRI